MVTTEATLNVPRSLADGDSDSDGEVGAQAPPLTKQISNILNRYPEGGQILKVRINCYTLTRAIYYTIESNWALIEVNRYTYCK